MRTLKCVEAGQWLLQFVVASACYTYIYMLDKNYKLTNTVVGELEAVVEMRGITSPE